MSHETLVAIEKIIGLCERSTTFTKRIEAILDTALYSRGMTANQRIEHIRLAREKSIQTQRDRHAAGKTNVNEFIRRDIESDIREEEKKRTDEVFANRLKTDSNEVFKTVGNSWNNCYILGETRLVKVSYEIIDPWPNASFILSVSGPKGLKMSKMFDTKRKMLNVFEKLLKLEAIYAEILIELGFE